MQRLPEAFAFVDVETTGLHPQYGRIIELAIYRVEKGNLVDSLNTLLDIDSGVAEEITQLTGITREQLEQAPHFRDVADQVLGLLEGATFVAHHARFDYAFIRNEFKRLGVTFVAPTLCTAKLFRVLIPGRRHYNLDALMEYYEIECETRHRAGPDAKVLMDWFAKGPAVHGPIFWEGVQKISARPSWPEKLAHLSPDQLPETPGVYIFKGDTDLPIYIGKSTNIRERVLSHFANDADAKELKLAQLVQDIEVIPTAGEMGALLLESQLIKKHLPLMNRQLRQGFGLIVAYEVDREEYPAVELTETNQLNEVDPGKLLGVFKNKKSAQSLLHEVGEKYRLCPRLLGLENGKGKCFWRHIGKCDGACDGVEPTWKYKAKFVEAFSKLRVKQWPFEGPVQYKEQTETTTVIWEVENWVINKLTTISTTEQEWSTEFTPKFDWDTYLILKKFLLK